MKKKSRIGLILIIILGFSSCAKKENYSFVPAITFKSFVVNSDGSATVILSFTDGDGDIGYQTSDNNAPPDFFLELLQDSGAGYYTPQFFPNLNNPVIGDTAGLVYTIPYITPAGKDKELSGQIQVQLAAGPGQWYLNDHKYYEYRIWISDRAGHVSNRLTTTPVLSP